MHGNILKKYSGLICRNFQRGNIAWVNAIKKLYHWKERLIIDIISDLSKLIYSLMHFW